MLGVSDGWLLGVAEGTSVGLFDIEGREDTDGTDEVLGYEVKLGAALIDGLEEIIFGRRG